MTCRPTATEPTRAPLGGDPAVAMRIGARRDEDRREWAIWSASGYRKAFQPRSVRRVEFFFALLLVAIVIGLIWAAKHYP